MASTKGKKRVVFAMEAAPESSVAVAGSFTGWKPVELSRKEQNGKATFEKMVYLPKGTYEYKFVIDGHWSVDPACREWTPNDHGTLNSVVRVSG